MKSATVVHETKTGACGFCTLMGEPKNSLQVAFAPSQLQSGQMAMNMWNMQLTLGANEELIPVQITRKRLKIPISMAAKRLPIPLFDYQRIFRVIKTVLDSSESDTAHACIFFSIVGALILQRFYGKNCVPVAGAAFYAMDGDEKVLMFASVSDDGTVTSDNRFHCWIRCEDYAIDFMAPIFRECLNTAGFPGKYSRKMFQKSLASMANGYTELVKPGDFFLQPDPVLSEVVLEQFESQITSVDLANICLNWFEKPPKLIASEMGMGSHDGVRKMVLSRIELAGAW